MARGKKQQEDLGAFTLKVDYPFHFKKKPSARNRCIGRSMRGKSFSSRQQAQSQFASAAAACRSRPTGLDRANS